MHRRTLFCSRSFRHIHEGAGLLLGGLEVVSHPERFDGCSPFITRAILLLFDSLSDINIRQVGSFCILNLLKKQVSSQRNITHCLLCVLAWCSYHLGWHISVSELWLLFFDRVNVLAHLWIHGHCDELFPFFVIFVGGEYIGVFRLLAHFIVIIRTAQLIHCVFHGMHLVDGWVHDSSIFQKRLTSDQIVVCASCCGLWYRLARLIAAEVGPEVWGYILLRKSTSIARLFHVFIFCVEDLMTIVLNLSKLLDRDLFCRSGWVWYTLDHFLEDDVRILSAKVSFDELLWI